MGIGKLKGKYDEVQRESRLEFSFQGQGECDSGWLGRSVAPAVFAIEEAGR